MRGRWRQRCRTKPAGSAPTLSVLPAELVDPNLARLSNHRVEDLCDSLGIEGVRELLMTFRIASQDRMAHLRSATDLGPAQAGILAREVQGAAATVGADRLAALFRELAVATSGADDAVFRGLIASTIDELDAVISRLARSEIDRRAGTEGKLFPTPARLPRDVGAFLIGAGSTGGRPDGGQFDNGHVLLVDDAPELRLLGHAVLTSAGFSVDVAADGRAALAQINDAALPDVVVLDVQMPDIDGWSTLAAIRLNPMTESLPVVVCTVREDPRDRLHACQLGADAYVTKSYEPGDFVQVVTEVVGRSEQERARIRGSRAEMAIAGNYRPL